jgi:hypothetical protein
VLQSAVLQTAVLQTAQPLMRDMSG